MDNREIVANLRHIRSWKCNGDADMYATITAAIEAIEQDGWIPAAERMPEKDGDYLVTYEKGYAEDYGLDSIGIAPFEVDCEGFGIWVESFDKMTLGSLGSDWTEIKVAAWMPLPEPFKEENNGVYRKTGGD